MNPFVLKRKIWKLRRDCFSNDNIKWKIASKFIDMYDEEIKIMEKMIALWNKYSPPRNKGIKK